MKRLALLIASVLALASCRNQGTNIVLASLDRSEKIDLLCADVEQQTGNLFDFRQVLPLEFCEEDIDFSDAVNAQSLGAVTQTESGTVAVVNFSNGAIFDTNVTVPGVTALRVGEQPTAIQISSFEPSFTYVTSFSPKSVQAIPTEAVIAGSTNLPEQDPIRFDGGPSDLALYERPALPNTPILDEEGQVTGVLSFLDYRFLYATIPDLGVVAEIEVEPASQPDGSIRHGFMRPPDLLPLDTFDCDSVTFVASPESDETDYNRICPEGEDDPEARFIKTVRTTQTCVDGDGTGPEPVAVIVDPGLPLNTPDGDGDDVLLVADSNQPVIHRFQLSSEGATPLDPIVTGVPTSDLSLTPFVPRSSDPSDRAATQRYLYAVSAVDGSVLAIDYTEDPPGTPEADQRFGAVLPVIAGITARATEENVESRNRVRSSFSNSRAIEVIAPSYELELDPDSDGLQVAEGDPDTDICNPADSEAFGLAQNASNMRGVFLSVSLSNGTMFFLDIYDLNAPCRGGQGAIACTRAETGPDRFASIRRHRRRFEFTPSTFISVDGTPSLQFNAAPGVIDEGNGEATSSDGPGLSFINCPESMLNIFGDPDMPTDGDALICASSQVWSSFTQRWDARWQGLIPETEGGLGLFADESFEGEPGNWFLAGDVPFCRVGVLGPQDGTPEDTDLSIDALETYGGDRLVIVGELPPNTQDDEDCRSNFEDLEEDIDERQVWFPIVRAFDDQLEIGESTNSRYTLDEVRRCFNQFTEYQIHTLDAYTVTGTSSGFIHRVVPDETTGECIFDDARPIERDDVDTFLTGRAFPATQFINPLVSFEITNFDESLQITDSTVALLNFNVLNQFGVELLDTATGNARSLPASSLFAPDRDELIFVDYEAGVRRIVFSPLSIVQTFE